MAEQDGGNEDREGMERENVAMVVLVVRKRRRKRKRSKKKS